MDKLQLFVINILLMCLRVAIAQQYNELPYEPVENICNRCKCMTSETVAVSSHYTLNCGGKGFTQIAGAYPTEWGDIPQNKEIDISYSGNDIKFLNPLPMTVAIVFFSCRHCQLNQIASAAFIDVTNILRLDLSWNNLAGDVLVSDTFRGRYNDKIYEPINVEDIDLSHNKIENLDYLIFEHTPYLKRLSLAHNKFNSLDNHTILALSTIRNMEHLDLSYTNLDTLPNELFNKTMPKLRELLVQGNRFLQVPESISFLKNSLRSLYVGGNLISHLTDNNFLVLSKLTHLFIGDMMELEEIDNGTFSFLHSMEVLNCRNNTKLKKFDLGGLINSWHLRELDLSNCSLKTLDLTLPKNISFESNDKNPDTQIFELPKLRSLKLEGNPWHCDCALYRSLEKLEHYGSDEFHSDDEARCATPYDLSGTLLTDVSIINICSVSENIKPPYEPGYEPPAFLRPRQILVTILSVVTVIVIGLIVGFIIGQIKKRLRNNDTLFGSPIRYTTVTNSTISVQ